MGDEFIPLTGELAALNGMPFCDLDDHPKAHIKGEVKDGKFIATSFKLKN